eukprot:TRINITY_DN6239_c0_g1_i1.p1 TRINITY_DN6239_c0_g1~~TRINITY_DN6239_c0_g1_i1.p1  ORF type:complete len:287 (+),score=62.86 TRINITY_DN6239_c0_g1_i1:89-862(+)
MARDDVASLSAPPVVFLQLSRQTYITLATDAVREKFSKYIPTGFSLDEVWFETAAGVALKWHIPVGVLYDLYGGGTLPWALTWHCQKFPVASVLPCPSVDTVRSLFMNQWKEALCIKAGDASGYNSMSEADQNEMWSAFINNDQKRFWAVNSKVQPPTPKNVALRVYRPGVPFLQELVSPTSEDGTPTTLETVLKSMLPALFSSSPLYPQLDSVGAPPGEPVVLMQGMPVPLCAAVADLSLYLSHPDNFLYIVVLSK